MNIQSISVRAVSIGVLEGFFFKENNNKKNYIRWKTTNLTNCLWPS